MVTSYREAAKTLWGEAGAYCHEAYATLRADHFPKLPAQLPIVIGITAYGRCIGLTRGGWTHGPRITIASNTFARGTLLVADIVAHEMLHVDLMLAGENPAHEGEPWYAAVRRLSPRLLGKELAVHRGTDRRSVRLPNPDYEPGNGQPRTVVRKERVGDTHALVAGWPHSFRPAGYYTAGRPLACPSY